MSWKDILKAELEIPDVVQFDTGALSDKCCSDARLEFMAAEQEYYLNPEGAESYMMNEGQRKAYFESNLEQVESLSCEELKAGIKEIIETRESIDWNAPENRLLNARKSSFIAHTKRLREILEEWEECEKLD